MAAFCTTIINTAWSSILALCLFIVGTTLDCGDSRRSSLLLVYGQECLPDGRCDRHERCPIWKDEGECSLNRQYMDEYCPVSCHDVPYGASKARRDMKLSGECKDMHKRCKAWADLGECDANPIDMNAYCAKSCGRCDLDEGGASKRAAAAAAAAGIDVDGNAYSDGDDEEFEVDDDVDCEDQHKSCRFWASKGECDANARYMHTYCALSCDTCTGSAAQSKKRRQQQTIKGRRGISQDDDPEQQGDATSTDDSSSPYHDIQQHTTRFGPYQRAEGGHAQDTINQMKKSIEYMDSEAVALLSAEIQKTCRNQNELCTFWAAIGECEKNAAYMQTNCAPSCMSCHQIDLNTRCPKLTGQEPALWPGDLNKMFERIVQTAPGNRTLTDDERIQLSDDVMPEYTVTVHSRPDEGSITEISAIQDKTLPPWVITFDNFITDEECDAMIELGYQHTYKRSEDVGDRKFDGSHDSVKSERRTSENAWCSDRDGCRQNVVPTRLHNRLAKVMNIPPENSEDFQILKYEKGQFYRTHHDYIPHQRDRQCGPRILTFFLYLSDVEKGGGTNFPQLDITVEPKKGRALLWPSVLDSDPMNKDGRMMHQALDVEEGLKFAANGWIHMYDYQGPQLRGCN